MTLSEVLRERLELAKVVLAARHILQLVQYYELLERWNRRLNLTSLPLDGFPPASVDRLLVEPVIAAQKVEPPFTWFDFGSGGGSPSIPMRILLPSSRLTMVEARGRKASFLREAVRRLELKDVAVLPIRIESVPSEADLTVDLISVRALNLGGDVSLRALRLLRPKGVLAAFGTKCPELEPSFRLSNAELLLPGSTLFTFQKS